MEVTFKKLTKFSDNIDPKNVTSFLVGVTFSIILIAVFNVTGILGNNFAWSDSSIDKLSAQEAGEKTEEFVNQNILETSPNNVTASFVSARTADSEGLPGFYTVELNITNPGASQVTEVFAKKDGSLVFLQFPRKLSADKFDSKRYH